MPRNEPERALIEPLVDLVLGVRAQYLAAYPKASLKHWDQIQERLRASARTSGTLSEMTTSLLRLLNIPAPSKATSSAVLAIESVGEEMAGHRVMSWIESNFALIMARSRLESERRKDAREEAAKTTEEGGLIRAC